MAQSKDEGCSCSSNIKQFCSSWHDLSPQPKCETVRKVSKLLNLFKTLMTYLTFLTQRVSLARDLRAFNARELR